MAAVSDAELLAALAEWEAFDRTLAKLPWTSREAIVACLRRALGRLPPTEARPQTPVPETKTALGLSLRVKVYSDGAARGNPGPAGAGAVVMSADGKLLARLGRYLGPATNNHAEYQGLLLGLERAAALGASEVSVYADSQLMIRQLEGRYRVRNEGLRPLFDEAKRRLQGFRHFDLHHIPREENGAADEMSNRAIDERM